MFGVCFRKSVHASPRPLQRAPAAREARIKASLRPEEAAGERRHAPPIVFLMVFLGAGLPPRGEESRPGRVAPPPAAGCLPHSGMSCCCSFPRRTRGSVSLPARHPEHRPPAHARRHRRRHPRTRCAGRATNWKDRAGPKRTIRRRPRRRCHGCPCRRRCCCCHRRRWVSCSRRSER